VLSNGSNQIKGEARPVFAGSVRYLGQFKVLTIIIVPFSFVRHITSYVNELNRISRSLLRFPMNERVERPAQYSIENNTIDYSEGCRAPDSMSCQ
jgi:hypothetical protein